VKGNGGYMTLLISYVQFDHLVQLHFLSFHFVFSPISIFLLRLIDIIAWTWETAGIFVFCFLLLALGAPFLSVCIAGLVLMGSIFLLFDTHVFYTLYIESRNSSFILQVFNRSFALCDNRIIFTMCHGE